VVDRAVICQGVTVGAGAVVPRGCVLARGVVIGPGAVLPEFTRVTRHASAGGSYKNINQVMCRYKCEERYIFLSPLLSFRFVCLID
jgi:carbonic anhydrase/acetyltransferase-like protein (isoleucine patch superfamily)